MLLYGIDWPEKLTKSLAYKNPEMIWSPRIEPELATHTEYSKEGREIQNEYKKWVKWLEFLFF